MRFARAVAAVLLAGCSAPVHAGRPSPTAVPAMSPLSSSQRGTNAASPSASPFTPLSAKVAPPTAPERSVRTLIAGARFDNPTQMLVDEKNVYVSSAGILLVVPKDGSAPPQQVFAKTQIVTALTADATDLYVGIYPADGPGPGGAIVRIDKATRSPTELCRTKMLTAIGVDDQHIWFGLLSDGAYRIDKKGGTPKTLFAGRGQVDAIGQDDANVYFGATRYGTKQRAEIDAVKKDGGAFSVITSDLYDAMGVVAVPGALFVNDNGVVKRFARSGGRSEKVSGVGSVVGLTHRGSEVLFSDIEISNENVAAGVWFAGTPPKLLAEASGAVGIAVDDETVYWADARARKLSALDLPPIP